jgi:hypothetical protein
MRKSSAHARTRHPLHAEALVASMTARVLAALVVVGKADSQQSGPRPNFSFGKCNGLTAAPAAIA